MRGRCTAASAAMIMRRAAMLTGDEDWAEIDEDMVVDAAWTWRGISWTFSCQNVSFKHGFIESTEDMIKLLDEHPEGIVAYCSWYPHAIALLDYDEDTETFYCSDPAPDTDQGRVPISKALIDIEDIDQCWYVTDPVDVEPPLDDLEIPKFEFTCPETV